MLLRHILQQMHEYKEICFFCFGTDGRVSGFFLVLSEQVSCIWLAFTGQQVDTQHFFVTPIVWQ